MKAILLLAASLPLWISLGSPPEEPRPVDKALDYVITKGEDWIRVKKCVTCHMIPPMMWSLREAESKRMLPAGIQAARDWSDKDVFREDPGPEGFAQMILARGKGRSDEVQNAMIQRLLASQEPNGSWTPKGQTPTQKRPKREAREVVTLWSMLALSESKDAKPAVDRARAIIDDSLVRVSNEWTILRYLVALRQGEKAIAEKELGRLKATQNTDGGWGWINGETSDAIATGQSLYALSFAPKSTGRPLIDKGRSFLLKTQQPDGSWESRSTLDEKKDQVIATSIYWGTAWAVIGLCRTER